MAQTKNLSTNFKYTSLATLLDIQSNGYLGKPRKVKGGWASVGYPPNEIDELIYDRMEKLDERGELQFFHEQRKEIKRHEAIDMIMKGYRNAIELDLLKNDQLTAFIELNKEVINNIKAIWP